MNLDVLAKKRGTDKSSEYHNYTPMYEFWLKDRPVANLLEVGFGKGGSARMWLEYLSLSSIYCIEYADEEFANKWKNPDVNIKNLNIQIGDSTKQETWDKYQDGFFDILIDDGSHDPNDQIKTFFLAFSKVKSGGLYFIEDTHCNFKEKYGGKDIIYKWFFDLVIQQQTPGIAVSGDFYNSRQYIEGVAKDILSYHFYKSVIVLEHA